MKRILIAGSMVIGGVLVSGSSWGAGHTITDMTPFLAATSAKGGSLKSVDTKQVEPPGPISGKIIQTMDSGGYTYLLIDSKGERIWAAISSSPVSMGQMVTVKPGSTMFNFTSKGLNRTFDRIIFSEGIEDKGGAANVVKAKTTAGSSGAAVPFSKLSVEKATGPAAYRIAALYANAKLNGKKVRVRGKVVKVSTGIMDRNWIHIQDGTGSPQKKNHNLVVTSKDLPDVGDIVTITGTLIRNKDFGSGYKYDVIVEKGTIVKEPVESKPVTP